MIEKRLIVVIVSTTISSKLVAVILVGSSGLVTFLLLFTFQQCQQRVECITRRQQGLIACNADE